MRSRLKYLKYLVSISVTLLQFSVLSATFFDRSLTNISRQSATKAVVGLTSCSSPFKGYQACIYVPRKDLTVNVKRLSSTVHTTKDENMSWRPLHTPNVDFHAYLFAKSDPNFIPKLYAALAHFMGPSDDEFDPLKGSFSFQFMLDVQKSGVNSLYWYHLMQYRSFMRIKLFESSINKDSSQKEGGIPVTNALLSEFDVSDFTQEFFDHLRDELKEEGYMPDPFCLTAESNLFISGFTEGQYFANKYKSHGEYVSALRRLTRSQKK